MPVAWIRDALDQLVSDGEVEISVESVGYRSAFRRGGPQHPRRHGELARDDADPARRSLTLRPRRDRQSQNRAVVDHGFDRYLATKRAARPSEDPVDDLRSGWDTHLEFALAHPAVYRLMFSPSFTEVPAAAGEAMARCATRSTASC